MRTCIIGTGQVGTHLAKAMQEHHVPIACLYNRTAERAKVLAEEVECNWTDELSGLTSDADIYFICVRDDAIGKVAEELSRELGSDLPVVHTSGVLSPQVLSPYFKTYGGWYPLNSFSRERPIAWRETPIFIKASDSDFEHTLKEMARKLSAVVLDLEDHQRLPLHISAVFVNNFTNYLLRISKDIAEQNHLSLDHLLPLLKTTIEKALEEDPDAVQTGPAARNDRQTMDKHMRYLEEHHPEYAKLYKLLSKGIQKAQRS